MAQIIGKASTSATDSFGETLSSSSTAFIQGSATYGLIPANFREFNASGGTTGIDNRKFKVSTGTSVGGYGAVQSFRALSHSEGSGAVCRVTGYFTDNPALCWQGIGLISIGDELSFGYNGVDFGIWHRYGGLPEVRTITVSGAAGGSETLTLTLNSVAYSIPLTSGTTQHNAYEISDWLNDSGNQGIWRADNIDSTIIISALSDGAKTGTYSFSSSTATGSIVQDKEGVTKDSSGFIPQNAWNGEPVDWLDPTKGNMYEITYQDMGWGNVLYRIMHPDENRFVTAHTKKLVNTSQTLQLPNPSLRCGMYAASIGSTTDVSVYVNSFYAGVYGSNNKTRNPRSATNTQTLSTTNFTNILTLRNRRTYNSYNNQAEIEPIKVSFASEVNKTVIIEIRATSDTGQEQVFSPAGNNLISDISTDAVTIASGRLLDSFTISPNGEKSFDLTPLEITLPPTLHLVIQAKRTGGSSGDVTATLTWYEDI